MRFVVERQVPFKLPDGGKVYIPVGHYIGPGKKSVLSTKPGHFGKPESYWKKPNIIKSMRKAA